MIPGERFGRQLRCGGDGPGGWGHGVSGSEAGARACGLSGNASGRAGRDVKQVGVERPGRVLGVGRPRGGVASWARRGESNAGCGAGGSGPRGELGRVG